MSDTPKVVSLHGMADPTTVLAQLMGEDVKNVVATVTLQNGESFVVWSQMPFIDAALLDTVHRNGFIPLFLEKINE